MSCGDQTVLDVSRTAVCTLTPSRAYSAGVSVLTMGSSPSLSGRQTKVQWTSVPSPAADSLSNAYKDCMVIHPFRSVALLRAVTTIP